MRTTKWQQSLILVVLMNMAWTTGCTSLQPVPLGDAPPQTLSVPVGEQVRVTRKDGSKQSFKVTAVEPDALVGDNVRVRYDEIATLEVRQRDRDKSIGLLVVSMIGAVVVTAILLEAASDFGALAAYQ